MLDKDGAVYFIGMSIILFPLHKRVYVFACLSFCTFRSKSHECPKIMSNVHIDHITPNLVLITANLKGYQTSMSHGDDMTIRPLIGLRKLLSWQIKIVNNLLCNKIYCTTIVNNHINGLVFDTYPHVKFLSLAPSFFFLFICIEEPTNGKSEIIFSYEKSLHNMSSLSKLLHARPSKHTLNTKGF